MPSYIYLKDLPLHSWHIGMLVTFRCLDGTIYKTGEDKSFERGGEEREREKEELHDASSRAGPWVMPSSCALIYTIVSFSFKAYGWLWAWIIASCQDGEGLNAPFDFLNACGDCWTFISHVVKAWSTGKFCTGNNSPWKEFGNISIIGSQPWGPRFYTTAMSNTLGQHT